MSDSERPSSPDDQLDVEQALTETETTLNTLKERYQNIQTAQKQKPEIQEQLQQLQNKAKQLQKESPRRQEQLQQLQADIAQLQEQLEHIDIVLESRLFKWWKEEAFWQFLRFSGLGFGAALLLNHLTQS